MLRLECCVARCVCGIRNAGHSAAGKYNLQVAMYSCCIAKQHMRLCFLSTSVCFILCLCRNSRKLSSCITSVYSWQVDSEMLDLVAIHRLSQLVCPAVCVEHVHDLQGDSATVHRAACIAKLTKLAAVKGPILTPSQEDVDYVNHSHTKIIMLQVQVLSCRMSIFAW